MLWLRALCTCLFRNNHEVKSNYCLNNIFQEMYVVEIKSVFIAGANNWMHFKSLWPPQHFN